MYQSIQTQQTVPLESANFDGPIDLTTFSNRRELEMKNVQDVYRQSENVGIESQRISNFTHSVF